MATERRFRFSQQHPRPFTEHSRIERQTGSEHGGIGAIEQPPSALSRLLRIATGQIQPAGEQLEGWELTEPGDGIVDQCRDLVASVTRSHAATDDTEPQQAVIWVTPTAMQRPIDTWQPRRLRSESVTSVMEQPGKVIPEVGAVRFGVESSDQ